MKIRRWKIIVWGLMAAAVTVSLPVAWWTYRFYHPPSVPAPAAKIASLIKDNDPVKMLSQANHYYWGHNLPAASPLYQKAEALFEQSHDDRDALYARIGLIRSQLEMPFGEMSDYLATQLKTPLVQHDPALRLWCLGIKGDADLEVKAGPARQDWEEAKSLADHLGDKQWANRASGELGLLNFLEGNYHQASYLVGHTLLTAIRDGDIGTQVRYLEIIGNGLNGLNRPSEGMVFCDRAIAIAGRDKDVGTPFMALESKAEALLMLNHKDQAQALMERTLAEAQSERTWEHEETSGSVSRPWGT